jgi:AraC-like DNA-binding protein
MAKVGFPEYQERKPEEFFINIGEVVQTDLHHHDFAELSLFIDGTGTESINGTDYAVRPSAASFLLPHHMHKLVSDSPPEQKLVKFRCMFELPFLFEEKDHSEFPKLVYSIGTTTPSVVYFDGEAEEQMRAAMAGLLKEYESPDTIGRRHMLKLKLSEAMLLFIRASHAANRASEPVAAACESLPMSQLLQYVHLHYLEKLRIEDLASRFCYSVPHISRMFKEQTGIRLHDYVQKLRIESAITLLLRTNMSVTDVATAAGFESFRTFTRVFRELKGMTASEFRDMRRGAAELQLQK